MTLPEPESETTAEPEFEPSSEPETEASSSPEAESVSEPETEGTPEFEPTAEQAILSASTMASASPEGESESSPETGTGRESAWAEVEPVLAAAEPESWPEAGPEWDAARSVWEEAWPLHVYFFSLAFLAVSVIAAYIVARALLQRGPRSSMSKTAIALNLMVFSFASTRAVFLLVDPYFSENAVPFIAARLVWSLGIPGFTASFSIMLLILLDTTRLSLAPPRFQNVGTVTVIWFVHLLIVLTSDLLVMYVQADVRPLLVMCQMLFVVYGALVSVGYAYVGVRMRGNVKASSEGYHEDDQTQKLRRLVSMTFLSSAVAFSVAVLNVYTAFSEFGPYAQVAFVPPWPYWSVHTCARFLEVFACSLVLMLFFRSGKASQLDGFCDQCRQRRKKRFVHPKAEGAIPPNKAVQGIAWRQSSETEMTDVK